MVTQSKTDQIVNDRFKREGPINWDRWDKWAAENATHRRLPKPKPIPKGRFRRNGPINWSEFNKWADKNAAPVIRNEPEEGEKEKPVPLYQLLPRAKIMAIPKWIQPKYRPSPDSGFNTPLTPIKPAALVHKTTERTQILAIPKWIRPKGKLPCASVESRPSYYTLHYNASQRIIDLARPKSEPYCPWDDPRRFRRRPMSRSQWHHHQEWLEVNAKPKKELGRRLKRRPKKPLKEIMSHVSTLAEPKPPKTKKFTGGLRFDQPLVPISKAAQKASASPRVSELAEPPSRKKTKKFTGGIEFGDFLRPIKKSTLKAKASDRISELAIPKRDLALEAELADERKRKRRRRRRRARST